ncbi:MAG TPA: methylmalonyl Co-A mutase-associated GTPase MeaB [Verrucomicrobiae bacterium]|nr:methylmalonyl Co-A mutase-associated GTPase MeaB [Verrucomicrobiae bacterium]
MQAFASSGWAVYFGPLFGTEDDFMNQVGNNPSDEANKPRRRALSPTDYVAGVLAGDRGILARAITLVESTSALHEAQAQEVLQRLLPHTGRSQRIGITGVPGVGKSTFIERFGCFLTAQGRKVAVLTIDPTSKRSGGSILGDKTRMEKLSREANAFIRPSPAGDSLGGVARRTRETLLLCEAAGFDTVLVETVGVGQSETTLRSMVDFFLLLLLPGAGDELQGIKKGIIEMADAVLVNKADGDNRLRAEQALAEQRNALHCLQAATPGWTTEVGLCSGLTGEGIPETWQLILRFYSQLEPAGVISKRRQQQSLEWLSSLVQDELLRRFYRAPKVKERLVALQQQVLLGQTTPVRAARELLEAFGLFT